MASFATPLSSLECIRTNHLAMKCNYYSSLLNMFGVHGDKTDRRSLFHPLLTLCLNRAWSIANIPYIYWGSLWGQICCSVIDGKLQLQHAPAAKTGKQGRDDSIK